MGYLVENRSLHKKVRKAIVPYTWRDASSWALIAELNRRSSEPFRIYECPYVQGIPATVWYLNSNISEASPQGEPAIRINNSGSVTVSRHMENHGCRISQGIPQDEDDRFDCLDMIFSTKPREIVREIESCYLGEVLSDLSPETEPSTIGARVIGAALGLFLHTKRPLRVQGFLFDGNKPRQDFLDYFKESIQINMNPPSAHDQVFFICDSNPLDERQYLESEPASAILALDLITGMAYTRSKQIDLMKNYEKVHRDIDALAFDVIRIARLEIKR